MDGWLLEPEPVHEEIFALFLGGLGASQLHRAPVELGVDGEEGRVKLKYGEAVFADGQ